VIAVAEKILVDRGFADMTFEAVARESAVAVPTIYSYFKSKVALVAAVLEHACFGEKYREALQITLDASDPRDRLRNASKIAASVYEPNERLFKMLSAGDALAPEIAEFNKELEQHRYEAQNLVIQQLADQNYLRTDLDVEKARDIMWMFTGRDIYHMLVKQRGWSVQAYQSWLADTLTASLVK
jgi:AcrR family transcriptional regulator